MENEEILKKIVSELIKSGVKTRRDLDCFKRKMSRQYKISSPKNIALLKTYHELLGNKRRQSSDIRCQRIEELLRVRPVRSLSGIVNVSVLTKPYPCPGKCIFCPSEKVCPKAIWPKSRLSSALF